MQKFLQELLAFVIGAVELVLALRFVLKLCGASNQAAFVQWIYETSLPLLHPFMFAFPSPSMNGIFVIEFSTLFALFAYAFAGYILQQLLEIMGRIGHHR